MKIPISLLIALISAQAPAHEKHLWEAGVGVVALDNPHYLGASQTSYHLLPLPYFIYRGKTVRADRDGVRGRIYDSEKLDLRLSLSGSLPVDSNENDARQGMANLDWVLEIGPTLQYQLYKSRDHLLRADWPLRAAFSVGDPLLRHRGWISNPRLHHSTGIGFWKLNTTLGLVFSDRRYHGYFYDVDERDVATDRSFYRASSGYTGSRFSLGINRRYRQFSMGAVARYYDLDGAANEDSPLFRQSYSFSFNLYFAWLFSESRGLVAD